MFTSSLPFPSSIFLDLIEVGGRCVNWANLRDYLLADLKLSVWLCFLLPGYKDQNSFEFFRGGSATRRVLLCSLSFHL